MAINDNTASALQSLGFFGFGSDYANKKISSIEKGYDTYTAQKGALANTSGPYNKKGRKALESKRKALEKAKFQAKVAAAQQYQYAKAEQAQKQGLKGLDKAFTDAASQTARGAELARQSVRESGQAAGAQATQSMMSRGLYGTTVQDQAQRAVSGDTARNLGMINTALAEQQGQLGIAKASAAQSGLAQLSSLYPQLAGLKTETSFNMLKALQEPPKKKKTPWYKKALGAVGAIVGNAVAPGIGAAIGGSFGGMFGGGGDGYQMPGTFIGAPTGTN
jgi:rubrerythrin